MVFASYFLHDIAPAGAVSGAPSPPHPRGQGMGSIVFISRNRVRKGGGWGMEKGEGSWGLEEVVLERTISKYLKNLFLILFFAYMRLKHGDRHIIANSLSHIHSYTPTPTSPRHSTSISWFSHRPDTDNLDLFLWQLFLLYVSLVLGSSNDTYRICAELNCALLIFFYLGFDGTRNVYSAELLLIILFYSGQSLFDHTKIWSLGILTELEDYLKEAVKKITDERCLVAMSSNQPIIRYALTYMCTVYSSTWTNWTARRILYNLKLIFFYYYVIGDDAGWVTRWWDY